MDSKNRMDGCVCASGAKVAEIIHPYCPAHVPPEMEAELASLRAELAERVRFADAATMQNNALHEENEALRVELAATSEAMERLEGLDAHILAALPYGPDDGTEDESDAWECVDYAAGEIKRLHRSTGIGQRGQRVTSYDRRVSQKQKPGELAAERLRNLADYLSDREGLNQGSLSRRLGIDPAYLSKLTASDPMKRRKSVGISLLNDVARTVPIRLSYFSDANVESIEEYLRTRVDGSLRAELAATETAMDDQRVRAKRAEAEVERLKAEHAQVAGALGCVHEQSMGECHAGTVDDVLCAIATLKARPVGVPWEVFDQLCACVSYAETYAPSYAVPTAINARMWLASLPDASPMAAYDGRELEDRPPPWQIDTEAEDV